MSESRRPPARKLIARVPPQTWLLPACAAMVFVTPPPAAARRPESLPDTIVVETLGELASQFADRFITGLEYAGKSAARRAGRDSLLKFSSDGLHMAFVHDLGTSRALVFDGVRGKEYRRIGRSVFSREGGHFAYFATPSAKGGTALVLDGQEFPIDEEIDEAIDSTLVLSPNGQHFAYVVVKKSQFRPAKVVVSDRVLGRLYDAVGRPVFSWDGERMGYVAQRRDRWVVVVDEVESNEYLSVTGPVFDLTGRHVSYTAGDRWNRYLFRDGEYVDLEVGATDLQFSRDGRHRAYVAPRGAKQVLVVDGRDGQPWERIRADTSLFGPDGNHAAYWGARGASWILIVDGKEIWEQKESPSPLQFTPDGKHVVHTQSRGWRSRVIVDATPGHEYDAIGLPRLSVNGRVGYVARSGRLWMVVVDDVEGPGFERIGSPAFSLDGNHVAYCAWTASDRACVIIDGQKGPEFDAVIPYGPTYHPDGALDYLALRGLLLLRVRHVPR